MNSHIDRKKRSIAGKYPTTAYRWSGAYIASRHLHHGNVVTRYINPARVNVADRRVATCDLITSHHASSQRARWFIKRITSQTVENAWFSGGMVTNPTTYPTTAGSQLVAADGEGVPLKLKNGTRPSANPSTEKPIPKKNFRLFGATLG